MPESGATEGHGEGGATALDDGGRAGCEPTPTPAGSGVVDEHNDALAPPPPADRTCERFEAVPPLAGRAAWGIAALFLAVFVGVASHAAQVEWRGLKAWARQAQMASMRSREPVMTDLGDASLVAGPASYVTMAIAEGGRRIGDPFEAGWRYPSDQLMAALAALGWLGAVMFAGRWVSRWTLRGFTGATPTGAESRAFSLPVGLTIAGVLVLVTGVAGVITSPAVRVLLAAACVVGLVSIASQFAGALRRRDRGDLVAPLPLPSAATPLPRELRPPTAPARPQRLLVGMCVGATLLLTFIAALAPATQSDGMRYHLGALSEWLKLGRVDFLESIAFAQFPFLIEMHFLSGLATLADPVTGGIFAKVFHWSLWVATFALIGEIVGELTVHRGDAARLAGKRVAWLAWAAVPSAGIVAGWSFIDAGIIVFWLSATLAFLRLGDPRRTARERLALVALLGIVLAGLAGTKYTMMPMAALWSLVAVSVVGRRDGWRASLVALGLLAIIGASLGGVWLIKNAIQTGNPFYPLSPGHLFPTPGWNDEAARFLADAMARKGAIAGADGTTWRVSGWLAWWMIVPYWRAFEAQSLGLLFPAALLTGLALVAMRLRGTTSASGSPRDGAAAGRWPIALIAAMAIAFYALWAATYLSARLLLPLAALVCVVPGVLVASSHGTADAGSRMLRWSTKCATLVAWCVAFAFQLHWFAIGQLPSPLPAALNGRGLDDYLRASLNYYDLAMKVSEVNPARTNGRRWPALDGHPSTLLLGEHRPYYFDGSIFFSDWFDPPRLADLFGRGESLPDDLLLMTSRGINHLAYNPHEFWLYATIPEMYALRLPQPARGRVGELLSLLHAIEDAEPQDQRLPGAAPSVGSPPARRSTQVLHVIELLNAIEARRDAKLPPMRPLAPFDAP
jgi:hypothetical protein